MCALSPRRWRNQGHSCVYLGGTVTSGHQSFASPGHARYRMGPQIPEERHLEASCWTHRRLTGANHTLSRWRRRQCLSPKGQIVNKYVFLLSKVQVSHKYTYAEYIHPCALTKWKKYLACEECTGHRFHSQLTRKEHTCDRASCWIAGLNVGLYLEGGLKAIHLFTRVKCNPDS